MAEYVGLSKPILINSQNVNVDYLYGPYKSLSLALSSIAPALRSVGKTVGIIDNTGVTEYWFESGIKDSDLIPKFLATHDIHTHTHTNKEELDKIDQDLSTLSDVIFKGLSVDYLTVNKKAIFELIQVVREQSISGKWIISPGGSIECNKVDTSDNYYRCYFLNDQENRRIENKFKEGDLAKCKSYNIKSGIYENVSNKYYWRKVVSVGDNYIDLSITDCDTNSDIPQKGDTICQLGSETDKTRQGAIVISSVDENSPSFTIYNGIDSYSLIDKEYVEFGVDPTTGKVFQNVYGNAYIGDKNKTNYIQLKDDTLEICAKFISKATGVDLETSIANLSDSLNNGKNQTDNQFIIWFGTIIPTLANEPAMEWTTNDIKDMHIDDWYFIKTESASGGLAYRFEKDSSGNYIWNNITDADTIAALTKASEAKNSADSAQSVADAAKNSAEIANNLLADISNDNKLSPSEKSSVLQQWNIIISELSANDAQADIYAVSRVSYDNSFQSLANYLNDGILWVSGTPSWLSNLTTTQDIVGSDFRSTFKAYYDARASLLNDIVTAAKNSAINTSKSYIDNNFVTATLHNQDLVALQNQIDGNITTWFYAYEPTMLNEPASEWNTISLKNQHLGDLFYNTTTGYCYRYMLANTVYSWTQIVDTDLSKALSDAAKAQDTADSKRRVFVSTPVVPYDIGDLWSQGSNGGILVCKTAKIVGQSYNLSDWVTASKYTDDTIANIAKENAEAAKEAADAAAADATTALNNINDLISDNILSTTEKQLQLIEWKQAVSDHLSYDSQATIYSITTEKTDYDNAFITLANYLNGGAKWVSNTTPLWFQNLSTSTAIVGDTYRNTWLSYYEKRGLLLNKITAQAKAIVESNIARQYVTTITYQEDIQAIQSQIDGAIETWFYDYIPTLTTAPTNEWTTDTIRNQHLGDLFYDTSTGYCYRYQLSNSVYSWSKITDTDVTKALSDAAKAQDTADHKRRIFVNTPTVPYDVGDLWSQGSNGDLMVCTSSKSTGIYNSSDWSLSSKYTDDSTALTKCRVFVSTPTPPYSVGDLWTNANYTDGANIVYTNDLLKCKVPKGTGASFNINDWEPANAATTAYIKNMGDTVKIEILGKDAQGNLNTVLTSINADSSGVKIHADKLAIDATVLANLIMASGLQVGVKDAQGNFTAVNFEVSQNGDVTAKNITAEGIIKANLLYTPFKLINLNGDGTYNWNPATDGNFIRVTGGSLGGYITVAMPSASTWAGTHLYLYVQQALGRTGPTYTTVASSDEFRFMAEKHPVDSYLDTKMVLHPLGGIYEFISDGYNWTVINYNTNMGPLVHTGIKDDSNNTITIDNNITYASFYNSLDKVANLPSNPIPFREIKLYRGGNGSVTINGNGKQLFAAGYLQSTVIMAHKSEMDTVVYNGVNWDYSFGNYN